MSSKFIQKFRKFSNLSWRSQMREVTTESLGTETEKSPGEETPPPASTAGLRTEDAATDRTETEPTLLHPGPGPGPGHVRDTQPSYLATSSLTRGWEWLLLHTPTLLEGKGEVGTENTGREGRIIRGEDEFVMIYFIQ